MLPAAILALTLLVQNAPVTVGMPESRPSVDSLWKFRKDIEKFAKLDSEKFPAPGFVATTQVRFTPAGDGDRAGLIIFGHDYAWLGLQSENGRLRLVLRRCNAAHQGGMEDELHGSETCSDVVFLRAIVSSGGRCRFAFSFDGAEYREVGDVFQAASSSWVGE